MCHNAPWLSAVDKQMRLQLRLKSPKLMSCRSSGGRAFHTLGPAAEKLLSPKMLWVRGTTQVLSLADRSRRRPLSAGATKILPICHPRGRSKTKTCERYTCGTTQRRNTETGRERTRMPSMRRILVRSVIMPPGTKHGTQQCSPIRFDTLAAQHRGQQNTSIPIQRTHTMITYNACNLCNFNTAQRHFLRTAYTTRRGAP